MLAWNLPKTVDKEVEVANCLRQAKPCLPNLLQQLEPQVLWQELCIKWHVDITSAHDVGGLV